MPNYHKDFPIILYWSQKSGCTTLLKWFFEQLGILEEAMKYSPWIHYYESQVYKNGTYPEELIEHILSGQKDSYKLVRNPYKRAVSQFLIFPTTRGLPEWEREWEQIREFFYGDKASKRGITFKQFLIYVRDYPGVIDDHLTPQYLDGEENFVQDYIYLERFSTQIKQIEKKYGLKTLDISQLSKSPHHYSENMKLQGNFANFEVVIDTFEKYKQFPTYQSFYNEETLSLVNSIYQKDFEVYGYKMNSL